MTSSVSSRSVQAKGELAKVPAGQGWAWLPHLNIHTIYTNNHFAVYTYVQHYIICMYKPVPPVSAKCTLREIIYYIMICYIMHIVPDNTSPLFEIHTTMYSRFAMHSHTHTLNNTLIYTHNIDIYDVRTHTKTQLTNNVINVVCVVTRIPCYILPNTNQFEWSVYCAYNIQHTIPTCLQ